MGKILVADDEANIRRLVCDFLNNSGFETLEAEDGDQAFALFQAQPEEISLLILDIMMPGLNGWEVCREVRETANTPILLLTARSEEFDQLLGYESGADDYITKPFSPVILVKHVQALLRRTQNTAAVGTAQHTLTLDQDAHEVKLNGEEIELTLKEYSILKKLLEMPGRVFTREQLLDAVWGYDYTGDVRTVDSHIARLRTKLGAWGNNHLKTVYGIGYKLEEVDG